MSLPEWRTSANQRRRIREAEQRRIRAPTPEILRPPTPPDPVSNILSSWILQRARERNAQADRLIEEVDGYLANPMTVNVMNFGRVNTLLHIEQHGDGNYVSTNPNFHAHWRDVTRAAIIADGLNMDDIRRLRQIALRPAPTQLAIDNQRLGHILTESDEEFLDG
jgi:hypothetical protein